MILTEQGRHLYIHEIRFVNKYLRCCFSPSFDKTMRKITMKGDSGNPTFLLVAGEPVLLETHSTGATGTGPFYSAPKTFAGLQQAVRDLDPNYRIKAILLEAAYARKATARRADRKIYKAWKTDGSLKNSPGSNRNHSSGTKKALPARVPQATPGAPRYPRVRRIPSPN